MELYSSEANLLKKQVAEWLEQPGYELEASFSRGRKLDQTTFLSVAKRLRSKGFTSLPQEDRLSIITRDHVRIDISSFAAIQQYCRDDTLTGKPYTAMIKDRAVTIPNIDIDEYGMRIKTRRELPMSSDDPAFKKLMSNWSSVPKAFRMLRRWIFEAPGFRIDMSVVKSTKVLKGGKFNWQRRFRDEDIMQTPPIYEIEIELLREEKDSVDNALKRLIKGSGEILRGIQKNMFLIRNSEVKRVLDAYKLLIDPESRDPIMKFRGPYTINLQKNNMSSTREEGQANIRDGYNVTDKADGLRCLGFCNSAGELYLIDMSLNIYKTGMRNLNCRNSLVDGEWVTLDNEKRAINQYLIFDIFYGMDKEDVSKFPFQPPGKDEEMKSRFGHMNAWVTKWNKDGLEMVLPGVNEKTRLQVSKKTFLFARAGDTSIFNNARRILETARPYYTDGLIFTSNNKPLPSGSSENFYEQFKWKPAKDNTIDFLVKFEKEEDKPEDKVSLGENPETRAPVEYKTLRLFVGSSTENPRSIVLNQLELPKKNRFIRGSGIKGEYRPVLFTPKDFPDSMASNCNLEMFTDPDSGEKYVKTEADEPIQDRTIVEMAYNPKAAPGWRWIPLRIRQDKTERLQSGILGRTLNSDKVAEDVWNSIYDPITLHMITTGSEEPSKEETDELANSMAGMGNKYYDRKAPIQDMRLTQPMRNFHNRYVKEGILYQVGLGGKKKVLLDMACGVGADLHIWRKNQVAFVLGVDYSTDNIRGMNDSIYRRYLEMAVNEGGMDKIPPMVFVVGNSSKNYENGDAAEGNEEERAILQSVIGRVKTTDTIPPFVAVNGKERLRQKADCMSCMFALHYFFENTTTFKGFLKNISDNLKVGGYFIGACFDGKLVFDKLRNTSKGDKIVGAEGSTTFWSIAKEYDEDELTDGEESLGLAIDVEFITIGTSHREYLVSFPYFVEEMRQIGCELFKTDVFEKSYKEANKKAANYVMLDAVKEFSFLNRWFIFKRTKYVGPLETEMSGLSSLKASATAAVGGPTAAEPVTDAVDEENAPDEMTAAALKGGGTATKYTQGELFLFYPDASEKDVLDLNEKRETLSAGQWLSPTAPFPIDDPYTKDVVYPTLEHYLNAMKFRVASNTPNMATTIFSKTGKIHQDMLQLRAVETEGDKKSISPERERALMKDEMSEMQKIMRPSSLKKYKSVIDETAWIGKREEVIREGLRQRWETDRRFRKIVEKARDLGKTLLYYTPGAKKTSNLLGGVRKSNGTIEGGNMIGKIIMELAGF